MQIHFILACLLISLVLPGCGRNPASIPEEGTGAVSFRMDASALPVPGLVRSGTIKVSAADMQDISVSIKVTDSVIQGTLTHVPAGRKRTVEITLFDSAGAAVYRGTAVADIKADALNIVNITLYRVTGSAVINGTLVEIPATGWSLFDGFESGDIEPRWTPYPGTVAAITGDKVHGGQGSLQVTRYDLKFTFPKPVTEGRISWWYYDNSGTPWTYLYVLVDTTTNPNLVEENPHVVTNLLGTYSFYHKSTGYRNTIPRVEGWRHFVATIAAGRITLSVDGLTGLIVEETRPVLAFQVAGGIIDDFSVQSFTGSLP